MASTRFYLRPSKIRPGYSFICVKFSWKRGKRVQKATGLELPTEAFDSTRQVVRDMAKVSKYRADYNAKLASILDFFADYTRENPVIDQKALSAAWATWYKQDEEIEGLPQDRPTFNQFVDDFIKNKAPTLKDKKTKRVPKPQTLRNYKVALTNLNKFNKALDFSEINLDFHERYLKHMDSLKLAPNSQGGYIRCLKVFCRWAKKEGYKIDPVVFTEEFFKPAEKSLSIYVSEDEINTIFKHDYQGNESDINVRNWFIIGCWTGLRVSDWKRINQIKEGKIYIQPLKTLNTTAREVVIPLHPQIKEIMATTGWPRKISSQKFNEYIKQVVKKAGITQQVMGSWKNPKTKRIEKGFFPKWMLVSSHTCRRSFATNLYKSNFPTVSIMQITGHSTEKAFLAYIKVTPEEHAEKLAHHWGQLYG